MRSKKSQQQHHKLTLALCVVWMLTLLYGEMLAFWVPSFFTCSWPTPPPNSPPVVVGVATSPANYIKVAVIADPQLMDRTSLHLHPKSLALELAEFYSDLYMRRAFSASILPFSPDVIVFLGDYFDGGPYLSDQEWKESLHRFRHIFAMSKNVEYPDKVYFIPGNHDVGYSYVYSKAPKVVGRYEEVFGIRNFLFSLGDVEFIAVDSQTLDGLPQENSTSLTWAFVKNVSTDNSQLTPRVLLTHIPLYRPDNTYCGIHRYSPIVNQRISRNGNNREILYQNYISDESSRQLLDMIKPALVLSGHDHDQCTVIHESMAGRVSEHTLGTISWQQGNLYPSFMLLSIRNSTNPERPDSSELLTTRLCFLPMQTHIYIWYICLFLLTIFSLLCWPTGGFSFWYHSEDLVGYIRDRSSVFGFRTKEKNDDEDCEYDMVWDAEGSMHLVRKPLGSTASKGSDRASAESRGNAVIRAAATRKCTHDIEESASTDANQDFYGQSTRSSNRSSKPTTRIIMHRLVRTLRMITVIAAVNVPLYVMILFKDWADS